MFQAARRQPTVRLWFALALATLVALALAVALGGLGTASAQESYTANIYLKDSNGNGLSGGTVLYRTSGSWNELGVTNDDGLATATLPKKDYRIRIEFRRGYIDTIDPIDITSHTFHTVKVHFLNSKEMHYRGYVGGFRSFSGPIELLPFTYDFSNQNNLKNRFELTIGPEGFTGGLLRLVDHNGDGLAGGTAQYYLGGWHSIPGQTDSNGNLVFSVPNDSSNLSMAVSYNGTREQQSRSELEASNFTFQTSLVIVQLKDADGNPLDPGRAGYNAGGWHNIGNTSGGEVSVEMLPGSYSFQMIYNSSSRQQLNNVAISGPTDTVVFQTGKLSFIFSESSAWYFEGWHGYSNPMEFLAGTLTLYLGKNGHGTGPTICTVDIPIAAGDHLVKSAVVATLHDSSGQPLAGGEGSAYVRGWTSIGITGNDGTICHLFDGEIGRTSVAMVYNGTRQQITQNQPSDSIYAFQTMGVTVELRDHAGSLIDTGSASYYARGWHSIGETSGGQVSLEMLPGSYSFAMVFNGTRDQKREEISGGTDTVTFQTVLVTVQLLDAAGSPFDTGSASYYARGWHTIGETSGGEASLEMLPGSYSFAMVYNGTRDQKREEIDGSTDTVVFQTALVTVMLQDADGSPLDNGSASYYARGWHTIGDTVGGEVTLQMLPGTYSFAMVYNGSRQQINHEEITGPTDSVVFQFS